MEAYGEDVWNYAYAITRNTHTADDVAQDGFIKAYQRYVSFRGEASVKTWLLTITRNTAFSYLKRAFLRRVVLIGRRRGVQTAVGDALYGTDGDLRLAQLDLDLQQLRI
ncbi:sigma-70 family RNA polymerase sigma factor [Paenibacillus cisolokensis]|uniref:RNA polymerase sigma factor n=1 Tax=Paenibacillus cisolokensis TaxID=1658519 RepID=UPI003D26B9C3